MGITSTTQLPPAIAISYANKLLSVPVPDMIHSIGAEKKVMPANGGDTLRMRQYNPLATAKVPLGDNGVNPPPQQLTAFNVDAKINYYGTYIGITERVTLTNQDSVLNEAALRLGESLRQSEDELIRDTLVSSTAFINCLGGTNGDSPTNISRGDVDEVVKRLKSNNAKMFVSGIPGSEAIGTAPIRSAYFALCSTDLIGQLERCDGWISSGNYPNQQNVLQSEWGSIGNLRFLVSSIGSKTSNASLLGEDVYNIMCIAKESYCVVDQNNYSTQFIYNPPSIAGGPLWRYSTVGFKMAMAQRVLNSSWVFKLRCTLAS